MSDFIVDFNAGGGFRVAPSDYVLVVFSRGGERFVSRPAAERAFDQAVANCRRKRHGWEFPVTLFRGGITLREVWA